MTREQLDLRVERDARDLERLRDCADRYIEELDRHERLWERDAAAPLTSDERRVVRLLFDRALDLEVAHDSVTSFHGGFWRIDPLDDLSRHARHFALATAAYLRRLSIGLELLGRVAGRAAFERTLDEPCPELGLGGGAYERLRSDLVDLEHVACVVAAAEYHDIMRSTAYDEVVRSCSYAASVLDDIDRTHERVSSQLTGRGPRWR